MTRLAVHAAGPGVTVQDEGRPGLLQQGISRGGAADPVAMAEGAALLGRGAAAALECAASPLEVSAEAAVRIALTGAPMRASVDGTRLAWGASHRLEPGARLSLRPEAGGYGYLHVAGGIGGPLVLGARSAHLAAGLGRPLAAGDDLPLEPDPDPAGPVGLSLPPASRFAGGTVRILPSAQSALFTGAERARFAATAFRRGARANRMGVRLDHDGEGFFIRDQRSIVSEVVVPGDIQIAGDGAPYVLGVECQTTGGYPRIGTVIPSDLAVVAQAPAGAPLRFAFVGRADALAAWRGHLRAMAELPRALRPLVRDPRDIPDLLSYQLAGGAVAADPGTLGARGPTVQEEEEEEDAS